VYFNFLGMNVDVLTPKTTPNRFFMSLYFQLDFVCANFGVCSSSYELEKSMFQINLINGNHKGCLFLNF
jgi:hypothetical protein